MELGLWSTIAIMLGFSALVIIMDEIIHARRRKAKGKDGLLQGRHSISSVSAGGPSGRRGLRRLRPRTRRRSALAR